MPSNRNSNADIWLAGAFAAFTVDVIVYPLDTLKTRLQSPDYVRLYGAQSGANRAVNPALFRGLYQGIGSVILATLPSSGAFFTTYEGVKAFLSHHNPEGSHGPGSSLVPTPVIHAAASGTAELVSCAILTPAEVIKQNAQMVDRSQGAAGQHINATLATMRRFRGNPLALWRGYTALAGRNLPFTALQFPLFERIRERVRQYRDDRGLRTHSLLEGGLITAVSAGSGGFLAAVITTPVDVVKTRIMLAAAETAAASQKESRGRNTASAGDGWLDATAKTAQGAKDNITAAVKDMTKPPTRKTSMQIAREIVRDSGIKGLFRGGALRGLWTMLGAGLYLGMYETGRSWLAQRRGEKVDQDDVV